MSGKRRCLRRSASSRLGNIMVFSAADQPDRYAAVAQGLHRRRGPRAGSVHVLPGHRGQPEADIWSDGNYWHRLYASRRRCASGYGSDCREPNAKYPDEGEILSRSLSVKQPAITVWNATDRRGAAGGWLHSGDAGFIDKDGHLVVIDRLSDVMHNKTGEIFQPDVSGKSLNSALTSKRRSSSRNRKGRYCRPNQYRSDVAPVRAEDRGISFMTFMDLSARRRSGPAGTR